jgi:soluble lytic murein transglycosylase-like protein
MNLLLPMVAGVSVILLASWQGQESGFAIQHERDSSLAADAQEVHPDGNLLERIRVRAPWLAGPDLDRLVLGLSKASSVTGLPVELLQALIEVESDYRVNARSGKGAIGFMQVKQVAAAEVGMDSGKLDDPYRNVVTGALYLDRMRRKFGSLGLALAAYAAGPANVAKGTVPRWYVRRVKSRFAQILEAQGCES